MGVAGYQFQIDWDDTGNYNGRFDTIPRHHVQNYRMAWGATIDPNASYITVDRSGGRLDLFDPEGLYYIAGDLTSEQLSTPHSWRLRIDGTVRRQGRAYPVFGEVVGGDIRPTTWRLEGPVEDVLDGPARLVSRNPAFLDRESEFQITRDEFRGGWYLTDMADEIVEHSDGRIQLLSTNRDVKFGSVYALSKSWVQLLEQAAQATGGFLWERWDGSIAITDYRCSGDITRRAA